MGLIPRQPVGECGLPVRKSLGDVELVGGKNGILGVTNKKTLGYKPAVSRPDASGICTAKLESRPKLEFDPYMSVKAGAYKLNKGEVDSPGSRCHGKAVTPWEVVDPATADKAAAGEREHCIDMQLAYAKTFARVEKFYDDLAGGFCADDPTASDLSSAEMCETEIENRFEKRMGFPQEEFAKRAHCLFRATNKRDENGWHCAIAHPTRFSPDCSEGWWTFDSATTLTEVDDATNKDKKRSHPPEEIVVDTGPECPASGGENPCQPKTPSGGAK